MSGYSLKRTHLQSWLVLVSPSTPRPAHLRLGSEQKRGQKDFQSQRNGELIVRVSLLEMSEKLHLYGDGSCHSVNILLLLVNE